MMSPMSDISKANKRHFGALKLANYRLLTHNKQKQNCNKYLTKRILLKPANAGTVFDVGVNFQALCFILWLQVLNPKKFQLLLITCYL